MVRVIGIGASAGGVEAILAFFRTIKNEKLAYIIVQHLSNEILLGNILQNDVKPNIIYAKNEQLIRPNHIYLNRPDQVLYVEGDKIKVEKVNKPTVQYPINVFFNSLAKNYREEAIGVILSGTGTDGTLGAIEIKSFGGLMLVQNPATAKFNAKPNAVINNSAADYINSPKNLAKFINTLRLKESAIDHDDYTLCRILEIVEQTTKIKFKAYKKPTLIRRVKRRMQFLKIDHFHGYLKKVREDNEECKQLQREFLIPVTSFFRDSDVFTHLEHQIFPQMVQRANDDCRTIRIWVTGCSVGSEAYSIGILLEETIKKLKLKVPYKIFASDIDFNSITKASKGLYNSSELNGLPTKYLPVYFTNIEDKTFQISKSLRDHFLFLNHDLLSDPPLINMDMISCRNILIYFKRTYQQNLIKKFHFSLINRGILLLGKSESISNRTTKLVEVNKGIKIYESKKENCLNPVNFSHGHFKAPEAISIVNYQQSSKTQKAQNNLFNTTSMNTSDNIYDLLLQEIKDNYLVIDETFEVIYNNIDIEGFFTMTKGSPNLNLLNMVNPELSLIFRKAANQVLEEIETLRLEAIEVGDSKGHSEVVDFLLKPVFNERFAKKTIIIEVIRLNQKEKIPKKVDFSRDSIVKSLKQELEYTKKSLTQLEAKLEASNEELQSTNEELQSSNEELQSSNEELQSLNEELYSVNAELQERMKELSQLNEESNQLIEGAELGMIVLDQHSFVLKYTKSAKKLFEIKDEQPSKNIFSLQRNFELNDFPQFINEGYKSLSIHEKEIKSYDGNHFTMRRIPMNNRLILLFLDINREKDIIDLHHTIFQNSNDFVSVFDENLKVQLSNKFVSQGWSSENTTEISILDFIPDGAQKNEVEINLKKMFEEGIPYEYHLKTTDLSGKMFAFLCKAHLIKQTDRVLGVLIGRDITLEKQKDFVLGHLASDVSDFVFSIDHAGNLVSFSSRHASIGEPYLEYYTKWDSILTLYKEDQKTKLQDTENPLLLAGKGNKIQKFKLHLVINSSGESFDLKGDFFPLNNEAIMNGAIAYLNKH